jgi:polysaccharide deacetylase family protein (PEP-CTERM system associated)
VDDRPALLLSIDFEDWHQLVHRRVGRSDWNRPYPEFERQTQALLDLLDQLGARATFFLLGMTAANYPELVRELVSRGHDAGSHGFAHVRVHDQTRTEFHADLTRSVETIEQLTGSRPVAYRAPAFSIGRTTVWAYEELADLGFRCDTSQYDSPRVRDRLGAIPRAPYLMRLESGRELWELPVAVWSSVPVGGGAYWRVVPMPVLRHGLEAVGEDNAFPMLYFHPYEFAPEPLHASLPPNPTGKQRLTAATRAAWRNAGRGLVARRLRTLARDYRLVSYDQVHDDIARRYGTRTRALSPQGVLV